MKPSEYIEAAARTDLPDYKPVLNRVLEDKDLVLKHLHYSMGVVTEAGEIMDQMKKHLMYGRPLDSVNLIEEYGDILWYVARGLKLLGVSFEDCMQININKLQKRFPEKFTEDNANNRDLTTERSQLETDILK